jgi:DNA-binding MarR family transcriptional regulator
MNVEEVIKTQKKIPPEARTIIHLLLVHTHINETITNVLKPFEVSPEQFNVLRILKGQGDKAANLCTLNERMITKMSNTTRLVDKLMAKGYVSRTICRANRRKVEIRITGEGKEVLNEMNEAIKNAEALLLKKFSRTDLLQLNALLDLF